MAASLQIVHAIASQQLGLVTREQLDSLRVSRGVFRGLLRRHVLVPCRPGVFCVIGSANNAQQSVLAAVMAAGKTAFASHVTAARAWELPLPQEYPPLGTGVELTITIERYAELPEVTIHRSGKLRDRDVVMLGDIPVASPERTIVDLSTRLSVAELGRMTDDALRRRITTLRRIHATIDRLGRAPGRSPKNVHAMLERRIGDVESHESVLEDFVYDALRRFGFPVPEAQFEVVVGGRRRRLDLCYPEPKVLLDVLGYAYHGSRERFDDDARRRNDLRSAGWTVLEITSSFTDVQIAETLAAALGHAPQRRGRPVGFAEWQRLR